MNQQQQQRLKHHPLLLLLLLLLLNGGAVVVVEARKKSTTVFLGSGVSAQWEIEGPCTAVTTEFDIEDEDQEDEDELNTNTNTNNAFLDPHTICFKSLSQRPQTFTLTMNMGEPGSNIQLPNFPFSANGQTCTTYLYRQAGLYNNVTFSAKLSSSSAASSNMIDFNVPWLIFPNGTCTTGSSAMSEAEADKPTDEVITTFNQIETTTASDSSSSSFHSLLFAAVTVSTTVVITILMNSMTM